MKKKILSLCVVALLMVILFTLTGCNNTDSKVEENSQDVNVENDEDVNAESVSVTMTAENYGDYINYNVDLNNDGNTTNDWRIFYSDDENIFIIAADYLENSKAPNSSVMVKGKNSTYSVYWNNDISKINTKAIDKNITSKYMLSWLDSNSYSGNDNIKAVATLLDTNNWTSFANGVEGAECIGAPTIEMYIASWNAKGYTKLYCNNMDDNGYYIGTNSMPTEDVVQMNSDVNGYADTLYYPAQNSKNDCCGYWLASPSVKDAKRVMVVDSRGMVSSVSYTNYLYAFRPVVSFSNNINMEKDSKGIWQIEK